MMPDANDTLTAAWHSTYESRSDLKVFGDSAIGLFALALHFGVDDLASVGATSITDGRDDKKCDLIYVNRDDAFAVVAQCHWGRREREAAPANKASDLNTAVGWLLSTRLDALPERIRPGATELRDAITDGAIETLYVWYVHNHPESSNVKSELDVVQASADSALARDFPDKRVNVITKEVGATTIEDWYNETRTPILVNDLIDIKIPAGYEVVGPEWRSYITVVPASLLYRQFRKHRTRLFSANIRDYLGSRQSDSNINNGIKKTLRDDPENFWVFNNGITVLVHDFEEVKGRRSLLLRIKGLSVVNGAQTTGAIGTGSSPPDPRAQVLARFVTTTSTDLIHNIVQYNNSQNRITASDFRSSDRIQRRLKDEFEKIPGTEYEGGRRGGAADAIQRRPNLLPSYTVGQALAAFHGDPVVAYNQKSEIWINDRLYSRYFNDDLHAPHIVFCFSLLKSIDKKKIELMEKSRKSEAITQAEDDQLSFLRIRGSNYLLVSAISGCLETILGRPVRSLARVSFGEKTSSSEGQRIWSKIVETLLPLSSELNDALANGLKSQDRVRSANATFHRLVQVTRAANEQVYRGFSKSVVRR